MRCFQLRNVFLKRGSNVAVKPPAKKYLNKTLTFFSHPSFSSPVTRRFHIPHTVSRTLLPSLPPSLLYHLIHPQTPCHSDTKVPQTGQRLWASFVLCLQEVSRSHFHWLLSESSPKCPWCPLSHPLSHPSLFPPLPEGNSLPWRLLEATSAWKPELWLNKYALNVFHVAKTKNQGDSIWSPRDTGVKQNRNHACH